MPEQNDIHKGQCRCGEVHFEVKGLPMVTMACHCTGCQQMTSSAFSLSTLYHASQFSLTRGEPVVGGLHGATRHMFCPHCMSWLFTHPEGMDELVNVRSTLMDDAPSFQPFIECYTSEMLPWATTGARHSFETFPPMESYPALMAEFAASLT